MGVDGARSIGARARMICRRRGLIENLAEALDCSVVDLTGQPYLPADRATADALAVIAEITPLLYDITLDRVPDVPARPVGPARHLGSAGPHALRGGPRLAVQAMDRGLAAAVRLGDPALAGFAGLARAGAFSCRGARRRVWELESLRNRFGGASTSSMTARK